MAQVNLHQHSEGSFLDGLARVSQIAKRARELGASAVSITDHNEVNQHLAFQKACRAEDVKPLLGIEADWVYSVDWTRANLKYPSNRSHICMIAENNKGLSNIWAMSTLAYSKPYKYKKPLLTPDLMRQYSDGVYASDGCMITELGRAIEAGNEDLARQHFAQLLGIFGDHFYSELHTWQFMDANTPKKVMLNALMGEINRAKVQFATEMGVPLVVVNDAHHAYPEHWENKELVWKINTKHSRGDDQDDGEEYGQKADHLMGDDEIYMWMERHGISTDIVSEAIKNAETIANRCDAEIVKTLEMPRLSKSEEDDLHLLMKNVHKGFQQKVIDRGLPQDIYEARLEEEMALITERRFAGYFNVEQDLVDATVSGRWVQQVSGGVKEPMLIGPGRGSAGGCLVAYLLGITTLDPIHYDLLFERFLDPGRDDNPDIDLDFPQSMRPGAKAYLEGRYGHDHVCTIGTLSRSQPKGVLKDVARALKIDLGDVKKMTKIIEQVTAIEAEVDEGEEGPAWEEVLEAKGGELSEWARKYPLLFTKINEMSGMVRQSSRHASGVVLSNQPLLGTIPSRTRADTPGAITQFDMYDVEELGACKMDLLGLRHLDTLMYARNLIYDRHGVWLDFRNEHPKDKGIVMPFGPEQFADPAIWPQIAAGHTTGIFQLETPDLTRHAVELKPLNENDVAVLISIVRPGVKDAGLGTVYLKRRAGELLVEYDHPLMQSITKDTYGVLVYQEQLLKTVKQLAGFTPSEANALRRALGKKKMDQVLSYKDKFRDGCDQNPEFTKFFDKQPTIAATIAASQAVIDRIWASIEASGRYAFNKSHAVGYATISNWEVWVKHYYPTEFVVSLMATDGENLNKYVREARRLRIPVLPPDINRSAQKFTIEGNSIRYGVDSLRGIGLATGRAIQRNRPYRSLADYLDRAETGANKGAVYNLIRVGAFDTLGDRVELLKELQYLRAIEDLAESTKANPEKLKTIVERRLGANQQYAIEIPDFDDPQVIYEIENELVGNYITVDPMGPYLDVIAQHCIADPSQIDGFRRSDRFSIGGQVTGIKPWVIKKEGMNKGKEMAFLNVQWNELDFDITCFADMWIRVKDMIKIGVPVIFFVERDDRGCHLIDLERLDLLRRRVS